MPLWDGLSRMIVNKVLLFNVLIVLDLISDVLFDVNLPFLTAFIKMEYSIASSDSLMRQHSILIVKILLVASCRANTIIASSLTLANRLQVHRHDDMGDLGNLRYTLFLLLLFISH